MITPTFLKDLRLLWPLALLTVALQAFQTWMPLRFYLLKAQIVLPQFVLQSSIVPMLALALLCALIVRLEPPQGEWDDWFTRPLSRGRIAVTKIVAILVMAHIPIIVVDTIFGLLIGIEPEQAVFAGSLRSAYIFALISLPALGAAAMAATLGQAIVGAVSIAVVFYFLDTSVARIDIGASPTYDRPTLVGLIALPLLAAWVGAMLFSLQFGRVRRATAAVWAAPVVIACALSFAPSWSHAAGLDRSSQERAGSSGFAISFDAARGPFSHNGDPYSWRLSAPMAFSSIGPEYASYYALAQPGEKRAVVFLPVRSAGTPAGEVWQALSPRIVIRGEKGDVLLSTFAGLDKPFPTRPDDPFGVQNEGRLIEDRIDSVGLSITLPPAFIRLHGEDRVSVEATFDITFLRKAREAPIKAGQQAIDGFGACTLSAPAGQESSTWRVNCFEPRMPPYCIALQLAEGGEWNPQCMPHYLPVRLGGMMTGPFPRSPPSGSIIAPGEPTLVIQDWRPTGHAMRTLTIQNIKLGDWTSAANETRPFGLPSPP